MKSISVSMKAVLTSLALVMITLSTTPAVAANPVTEEPAGVQVKYIGSVNEQNVFEVSLNSSSSDTYVLTLKTAGGETLYTEKFTGKLYSKKFLLENELNNEVLTVTVTSQSTKNAETFKLRHNVSTVSNVDIVKVK